MATRQVTDPSTIERLKAAPANPTLSLLREFEGFRETPYWDVNAFRTGYGSDTITRADGTVVPVQKGMTVSREDAERDLARRTREFEQTAIGQVGPDAWAKLPGNARSALTSVAYNYGSLPGSVVSAVKAGDVNTVADAVYGLRGHNDGVNANRRAKEAAIIRGEAYSPSAAPVMSASATPSATPMGGQGAPAAPAMTSGQPMPQSNAFAALARPAAPALTVAELQIAPQNVLAPQSAPRQPTQNILSYLPSRTALRA